MNVSKFLIVTFIPLPGYPQTKHGVNAFYHEFMLVNGWKTFNRTAQHILENGTLCLANLEETPGWSKKKTGEQTRIRDHEVAENRKILLSNVVVRKRCHRYTLLFLFCAAHALVSLFSVLLQR